MNLEIEAYEGELRELRQALAQAEQEPVGYVTIENISSWAQVPSIKWFKKPTDGPLYTAPPALAQAEQEPVAYLDEGLGAFYWANDYKKNVGFTPLYAVPPHRWSNTTDEALMQEVRRRGFVIRDAQIGREWVGLTDEEIEECKIDGGLPHTVNWRLSAKVMQAKLKEKNT